MLAGKELRKAIWYLYLSSTILIMAFLGYVIGKQYNQPELGTLIGTIFGTLLMWFEILRMEGLIGRKQRDRASD